jgi:hypothetical protein
MSLPPFQANKRKASGSDEATGAGLEKSIGNFCV